MTKAVINVHTKAFFFMAPPFEDREYSVNIPYLIDLSQLVEINVVPDLLS